MCNTRHVGRSEDIGNSRLRDLPGYLGYERTSHGSFILAIHADWPVYPCPPGDGHALFDFAMFPVGTEFIKEDDIDQCVLFRARNYGEAEPSRDENAFFVAAWHEDLITLAERGAINRVREVSCDMWRYLNHNELTGGKQLYYQLPDGSYEPITNPVKPDADAEDDFTPGGFVYVDPGVPVVISDVGWQIVESALAGSIDLGSSLSHVSKLIELGLYDTAVREVSVALESTLRDQTGSRLYGQQLVSRFLKELARDHGPVRSAQSIYGLRLRSFFRFVRNEFAHNRVELPRSRGLSIIAHGAMLLNDVTELGSLSAED
jgi:hypothetical protein